MDIQREISALMDSVQSVQLATLGSEGFPQISATPYLQCAGCFYVFVSRLAPHTANLMERKQASLLLIEDEHAAKNVFARRRLIVECLAESLERQDPEWECLLDRFEAERGPTVAVLRQLPDFLWIKLRPLRGSYIEGFGQAYRFEGFDATQAKRQTG